MGILTLGYADMVRWWGYTFVGLVDLLLIMRWGYMRHGGKKPESSSKILGWGFCYGGGYNGIR